MSCLSNERYRVIFMERDLDEVIRSQEKMLARLGKPAAPAPEIKRLFTSHLEQLREWLAEQRYIDVLYVHYKDVVERPDGRRARQRVPRRQGRRPGDGQVGGPVAVQEPQVAHERE